MGHLEGAWVKIYRSFGTIESGVEREGHVEKAIDHGCNSRGLKYYSTFAIISLQQLVLFGCMCIERCFYLFSVLLLFY